MSQKRKQQKVDKKVIMQATAFASAMDNWMQADDVDALLAETGKTRQQLLDAVMADDEVISCREDIEGAINAATWRIWGDDVNEDIINRLYRNVRSLLSDFVGLAILAKFNGYAVAEYTYEQEADGFIKLNKVLSKDGELDRYTPQRDGSVIVSIDGEEIEINQKTKHLVLTNKAVPARPAGELLVIRAYPAVALRKRDLAYAGQFIARYAQPYVVGKQGGNDYAVSDKRLSNFTNKVFAFISGGAIGIGKEDSIDLLQLNGNGEAFEMLERMANRRIQKILLGRVKTSELTSGSRSAQETDDEARQDRVKTYLALMTKAVQHAIDAILKVNERWGMSIYAPQGIWFEYPDVKKFSKKEAEIDAIYAATGQVRFTKQRLLNIGYEESEFEIITATNPPDSTINLSRQQVMQLSQNLPTILMADDDKQTAKEQALISPKIQALLSACDECDSYAEFEKRIAKLDLPDDGLIADLAGELVDSFADGLAHDSSKSPQPPFDAKGG